MGWESSFMEVSNKPWRCHLGYPSKASRFIPSWMTMTTRIEAHRKTTGGSLDVPICSNKSDELTSWDWFFFPKITGSSNESTSYYSWSKCPIRSRWETLCQVHQVQCPGDRLRSSAASDNPWLPDICNNLPKGKSHWIPWNLVRYHQILLNPIQSH